MRSNVYLRASKHAPRRRPAALLAALALASVCVGCNRPAELSYVPSALALELDEKQQAEVADNLTRLCGTPDRPKLLGDSSISQERLKHGAELYQKRCAQCHGVSGDGAGIAAEYMNPRPRDYRPGRFKFNSTESYSKPVRSDLVRIIRRGARGTSMPSFALMPEDDVQAIVDYVMSLTHRGELEMLLALEAQNEDKIDPERVPEIVEEVLEPWRVARDKVITPPVAMPRYTPESIELGKQAFQTKTADCFKCHGLDGRGGTTDNEAGFKDNWGFKTRAADLTAGSFHGGNRPIDIYRRIDGGVNGTPMPSFHMALSEQPETIWHLVHYVQYIAGARRREVIAEHEARKQLEGQSDGNK